MKVHRVNQGEFLASIARQYKISRWQTIYEHADNAEFRRKRPNPNVIHPGDRIVIPDMETRTEKGATDERHRFRVETPKTLLRIMLRDEDGEPLANEPYKLTYDDTELDDITDGEGLVEQEIPVGVREATIRLDKYDLTMPLQVGGLDPVDDEDDTSRIVAGAQARLNNLGYYCGSVDGDDGPKTSAALRSFQKQKLDRSEPDGKLDKETRKLLVIEHGS
jgi:hypothetical protein